MNNSSKHLLFLVLTIAVISVGCQSRDKQIVTIFHAASLAPFFEPLEKQMKNLNPQLDLRLEPSGSQVAARKVSELNREADLIMVADKNVIDAILIPEHATFNLVFASNEIVLAYGDHSRYTDKINSRNWYRIVQKPDVRLGMANENLAPIGYQTMHTLQLAQLYYGEENTGKNLSERLKKRCRPEHVTPDIGELISLLQTRALDYAFIFRSMAEQHRLKIVRLPKECNLSDPNLNPHYSGVSTLVTMKSNLDPVKIQGEAIQYSLTIPKSARNPKAAGQIVEFLFGPYGQNILQQQGFNPLPRNKTPATEPLPLDPNHRGLR